MKKDPPPSTTNTAARELPPSCGPADTLSNETLVEVAVQSAARNAMYDNKVQHDRLQECKAELLRRLATLTKQQGGEQEAGDVEQHARELLAAECERDGGLDAAKEIRAGYLTGHEKRAIRAITAALRTKQPAASDCDRDRDTGRRRAAVEILLATGWQWQEGKWQPAASEGDGRAAFEKWIADQFGYSTEKMVWDDKQYRFGPTGFLWEAWEASAAARANTSKQAAGEAVSWQNIETAEVELLNNLAEKGGLADPVPGMLRHCAKLIDGLARFKTRATAPPDRYETEEEGDAFAHGYVAGFDDAKVATNT